MDVRLRAELVKVYMRRMIGNLMGDSVKGTATLCKEHVGLNSAIQPGPHLRVTSD